MVWPDLTGQQSGPESWRPWLRQVWTIPEFAAAVKQASPVLAARMAAVCDRAGISDREARRVLLSVMRYLLRAVGRATPYGLFAGVAPARAATTGAVRMGSAHRPVTRVRAQHLAVLVDQLEADTRHWPRVTVRANNLVVERDGSLELAYRANDTPGGAPGRLTVRATDPVRAALRLAREPIRLDRLAATLGDEFAVDAERVTELLRQMVSQRLLVTNVRPPMASTFPPACTTLDQPRAERVSGSGVRAEAVDLRLDCAVTVPQIVVDEAARAAGLLVRLAAPAAAAWVSWHGRFLERYGLRAMVPVLLAVDTDVGIGYPAGYHGAPRVRPSALTGRDRMLLAMAQRAALTGQTELVLGEATVAELTGGDPLTSVQPSVELTVRVDAASMDAVQRGEFRLSILGVYRCAGTTAGRFLDLFEAADRERMLAQYAALPTVTGGALLAQVSAAAPYTISEDVARSPRVLPHLIPVGEYHDDRTEGLIRLEDVAVTADRNRLYLVWVPRRRVVEPVVFNAVEPVHHMLPIARFLVEAPTALSTMCTAFDWSAAATLPFLPALRHARTIVSPARWLLPASDLPGPGASWPDWSRSLTGWLHATRCPRMVYLGEGDQRIRLDLTESAHQALLRDQLTRRGNAALRAAPAADAAGWIGGYAHEIAIPVAACVAPAPPPQLADRLDPVRVREHGHLPGCDGHLYIKLYGHADRQTTILTRHLPTLLAELDPGDRWWFLRYIDPQPHLRLRLTGHVDPSAVGAWAQRLRRAGLIARVAFDTDYPETARFGGPAALTAAEDVFAADSAATLTQLALVNRNQVPHPQAVTAASLLDLAAAFIGDLAEAMRWLIAHTATHRPAPDRAVYHQAVGLANPYDHTELAALPGGEPILTAWRRRRHALATYQQTLSAAGTGPPAALLRDLLHLHHTRMAGPDLDGERACLHLARAAALSWTARARSQP